MSLSNRKTTTVGKTYTIDKLENDELIIIDDYEHMHYFSRDDDLEDNWKKYFWDIREQRKNKLQKIQEVRNGLT
jgi:hypothetical protein